MIQASTKAMFVLGIDTRGTVDTVFARCLSACEDVAPSRTCARLGIYRRGSFAECAAVVLAQHPGSIGPDTPLPGAE